MSARDIPSLIILVDTARLFYFPYESYHKQLDIFFTIGVHLASTISRKLLDENNCSWCSIAVSVIEIVYVVFVGTKTQQRGNVIMYTPYMPIIGDLFTLKI